MPKGTIRNPGTRKAAAKRVRDGVPSTKFFEGDGLLPIQHTLDYYGHKRKLAGDSQAGRTRADMQGAKSSTPRSGDFANTEAARLKRGMNALKSYGIKSSGGKGW